MNIRSLKFRMMVYSIVMVVLGVVSLASVLLYYHHKHVWAEFELRTSSLVTALANDLQLLVLLENKKEIERVLEGVLKVPDVVSALVFKKDRELLVRVGEFPAIPQKYRKAIELDIEIESGGVTGDFWEPAEAKGLEKIGSVEIVFNTLRLKNDMIDIIILLILFTSGLIALRITSDYFFTAGITGPIGKLVEGSEAVAGGDLDQYIEIKREDEVGALASSFNAMVRSLKERSDEVKDRQRQIEDNAQKINKSLHEKELLLKEIHHRVKNNMQLISSMLKLQSKYVTEKKDVAIFMDCRDRIKSMSLIHEKLYKSKDLSFIDFTLYVKSLTKGLFRSYVVDPNKVALKIDSEDIFLGIDTAIPCGLIINELISNSMKHAFPQGRKGEIRILLRSSDSDSLELSIGDDGVGLPEDFDIKTAGSLGLILVDTLVRQLHGKLDIISRKNGTQFTLKFKELKYQDRV